MTRGWLLSTLIALLLINWSTGMLTWPLINDPVSILTKLLAHSQVTVYPILSGCTIHMVTPLPWGGCCKSADQKHGKLCVIMASTVAHYQKWLVENWGLLAVT